MASDKIQHKGGNVSTEKETKNLSSDKQPLHYPGLELNFLVHWQIFAYKTFQI